jgi:hypothetical protein
MRPASDPNSGISSNTPSKRLLFGDIGQKHTLRNGSISKIVEPDVYYENTPQSDNWTMGNGLQSHNLSWDGDSGLSETLQSLAISIKDTAVKQGWKMVYNQAKVDRLLGAIKSLSSVFEELHTKGWAAGYCHPNNIFIKKDGTVFLADLGFYYTGDAESSFAPSWVKERRAEAFYWENDTPQIRMAKPGSTVDFKESDARLFGRILAAVISVEFHAKPDVSITPIGPLSDYWKIAVKLVSGLSVLSELKFGFGGKTDTDDTLKDNTKPSNGFPTKLVIGMVVLLGLGLGGYFVSKNWKITHDKTVAPIVTKPAPPIISPLPTPVTTDKELEKLYQAAITCTKDERLGNFSKLAAYNKESPEKLAKVIAVRLMLSSEFQAELLELDTKVQTDALLEYPTATAMEKLLVKVTEIRRAGGIYEDEKTKAHENSNYEFASRRIQELRRE